MKNIRKAGLGVAAAIALILVQAGPAHANAQAKDADVVGVGSDTAQYALDFFADGDATGNSGVNTTASDRHVFNFDASGDANGRLTALTPPLTTVLREGTKPVTLPNGSGAGITALLADTGTKEQINFVRASRLPTAAECATAANTTSNGVNWGSLHVYQFATDGLKVAVSNLVTTQVPVLAKADLTKIYNGTWTTIDDVNAQVVPGAHTGTLLKPYVPQSGSGTRSAFLGDIGVTTLGSNVLTSEEHDPSPIKSDPVALGPFSTGRINMLNGGYFGVANQNTVVTQAGTGPGGAAYALTRGLYVIVRERDVNEAPVSGTPGTPGASGIPVPWQIGGSANFVKFLFSGTTSKLGRALFAQPLVESAGLTYSYSDLGNNCP